MALTRVKASLLNGVITPSSAGFTTTVALSSGTTSAPPLLFSSGSNLTVPYQGSMEFDGTNFYLTPASTRKTIAFTDSTMTGNAATATKWATQRQITLTGDASGSVYIDGSGDVNLAVTVSSNSIALGTDTTGNYVASIANGAYITGGAAGAEGSVLTLAVDATSANTASKVVARDASGNFSAGTITAALTGNASTASTLQTARNINGTSFNGSANITFGTDSVAEGSTNLYYTVARVKSYLGDGAFDGNIIPATNNTYSLGSAVKTWKDLYVGPGSLYVNGKKVVEDISGTITFSTDINQNLSIQTSGSGDIQLDPVGTGVIAVKGPLQIEASQNITSSDGNAIGFSNQIAVDSITSKTANTDITIVAAGTGKVYLNDNVTVGNNLIVTGNLTVSGTTTTVNSETISLADNIIDLNSNFTTGTPTENAGIRIMRGDEPATQLRWTEATDNWSYTTDGTAYYTIVGATDTQTLTNKTIVAGSNTISGLTNSNLSGSAAISNANLANSAVTVGSTSISLGATSTTLAGLTSVTSTTFVGALTGNASTATALATSRTLAVAGDLSGSAGFDGSANATISATLASTGVTAGTYGSASTHPVIIVDAKGRITSATNTTIAIASTQVTDFNEAVQDSASSMITNGVHTGITATYTDASDYLSLALTSTGVSAGTYNTVTVDVKGRVSAGSNAAYLTGNQSITVSGDATGSGTTSISLTLANTAVTAGTYGFANTSTGTGNKKIGTVIVDSKGRVTGITERTWALRHSDVLIVTDAAVLTYTFLYNASAMSVDTDNVTIFNNRLKMRANEYTVNSGGTITFVTGTIDASDELEITTINYI